MAIAQESGLAGRYANAVFELAVEQKAVDAVAADFAALAKALAASPDLARLVRSPLYSTENQAKGLAALLTQMGAHKLSVNFVLTVAAKGRLFALEDMILAYNRLLARRNGEVEAEVTSARVLSDAEIQDLKAVLKAKLGREPRLHAKVDASLLGGLVVKVGSRMIDSSLRTKLSGLGAAMRGH